MHGHLIIVVQRTRQKSLPAASLSLERVDKTPLPQIPHQPQDQNPDGDGNDLDISSPAKLASS